MAINGFLLFLLAKGKVTKQTSQTKKSQGKLKRLVISNSGNLTRLTSLDSVTSSSDGHISPPAAYNMKPGEPHSQGIYSGEESVFGDSPQSSPYDTMGHANDYYYHYSGQPSPNDNNNQYTTTYRPASLVLPEPQLPATVKEELVSPTTEDLENMEGLMEFNPAFDCQFPGILADVGSTLFDDSNDLDFYNIPSDVYH